MTLLELLRGAEVLAHGGNPQVRGIAYDSRLVKPGDVFVAMRGESSDGNQFVPQAIAAGAAAVVTDSGSVPEKVAWARVPHVRRALALMSANLFTHPVNKLALSGITGTNGKSTTAFLLESVLLAAGRKTALIGTIEYHIGGKTLPAPHTTPESLELQKLFRDALGHGATEGVMEVSSHALAQQRTFGIPFDVAIFTNLTQDHLDYHGTMEEYFSAKRLLFLGYDKVAPRAAVLNIDDPYGRELVQICKAHGAQTLTYGLSGGDFHSRNVAISSRGTQFEAATPSGTIPVASPLIGRVNIYNILAAVAAAQARRCSPEAIQAGIKNLAAVPGRFERVDCNQPFTVVVDYAHTHDALRNLAALAREFVTPVNGRVITVFGCGGDRDRAKRPMMGEAAGRGSDLVVLTSDNPRSEDPLAIINDAVVGLQRAGATYKVEAERRAAVLLAVREARPGDIVLIAGKGHEKVQITKNGAVPFDDKQAATTALRDLGYECSAAAGKTA